MLNLKLVVKELAKAIIEQQKSGQLCPETINLLEIISEN